MAMLHCRLAVLFFILSIFSYVLCVSALHKQSTDMLSSSKGGPSFTVKLYTRDSLGLSTFKNYRDSTLARLKRDAARVNFISTKLNPVKEGNVSVISGAPQHSYEYFARFGIGTPAKQFYTAIDTGTDITWIQCLCDDKSSCYSQTDPFFKPSKSSSYKPLSCDAPKCLELPPSYHDPACTTAAECNYHVLYVDNSTTAGDLATETFQSGSSVINDVAIGCGHNNQGKFNGSAGILALGLGSLSFPSQIKAKSFSYCLVNYSSNSTSSMSFGAPMPKDAIRIPFLHDLNTYYAISLTAISVGERKFSMYKAYGARGLPLAVDSGTFLTYLPLSQYNAIRDEFVKGVHLPSVKLETNSLECFKITSAATESLPTIKFHFDAKTLVLPTKTYLMPEYNNSACFTFAPIQPSNNAPFGILGSQQQQGTEVILDLANSLIGFSANKC
ncbi:hypothetical protein ACHQM5_021666 [Ranunculus cassubicifolius]